MADPAITFFPVGNGDTVLMRLPDGGHILVDCNITVDSTNPKVTDRYDVRQHLLKVLPKDDAGVPHLDAFVLTHPDQDHCRGFDDVFYVGDPCKYGESHKKKQLIRIDELWFSPRVFTEFHKDLSDPAKAFKKEAWRRVDLERAISADRIIAGNRLRVVGYSDAEEINGLEKVQIGPGTSTSTVNRKDRERFSLFLHAPFKRHTDDDDGSRNDTSVVMQLTFDVDETKRAGLVLLGGDAEYEVWERILELSSDDTLQFDLFLAPHHCSWTFFNDCPQADNPKPREKPLELLNKCQMGAKVIASSKHIQDDDDNPPHFEAAKEYKAVVGAKNFLVTADHLHNKVPVPITFEFSANGPVKVDAAESGEVLEESVKGAATGTPQTYG